MEAVKVKAYLVKGKPEELTLRIDKGWYNALRGYAKQEGWHEGSAISLTMFSWIEDAKIRAKKLFHALRDRLAINAGDNTQEYREHLKISLKQEFGPTDPETGKLKSMTKYDMDELHRLIEGTVATCMGEEIFIEDLLAEEKEL